MRPDLSCRVLPGFISIFVLSSLSIALPINSARSLSIQFIESVNKNLFPNLGERGRTVAQVGGASRLFTLPDLGGRGRTVSREGGASRSPNACVSPDNDVLTVFQPSLADAAQTTLSHPTFWFYVPYQHGNFASMSFSLWTKTAGGETTFLFNQVPVETSAMQPGVIGVQLPSSFRGLVVDQKYSGALTIHCEANQPSLDVAVRMTVTRVAGGQAVGSTYDQVASSAGAGLWYDALEVLGNARLQEPNNGLLSDTWMQLLQDVELSDMASKPLVDCCQLAQ